MANFTSIAEGNSKADRITILFDTRSPRKARR